MKITKFDPPGNNGDFAGNPALAEKWSSHMSGYFDEGVQSVRQKLAAGGTPQFYNPVTNGSTAPDVAGAAGVITWNGFPRKFLSTGPGVPTDFAGAEPTPNVGRVRPQDEYLEWFVKKAAGKITSVQFTCEGFDYYRFLNDNAPNVLLALYQQFISPAVKLADLQSAGGAYNIVNKWNTKSGAMHLTEQANNLFAEVILGAEATVRRKRPNGQEVVSAIPLTRCAQFGDETRNSDPAIGAAVNALARQGRMITLANPVGLYIDSLDDSAFRLPDGSATTGWFKILRGSAGLTLRAIFEPPAGSPFKVSDVKIGGVPVTFGGHIAQHITMKLVGVASVSQTVQNAPVPCAGVSPVAAIAAAVAAARPALPPRRGGR